MTVALILAGALLTALSCLAAGRLAFQFAHLPREASIEFTTGAALLSTVIFALCALHLISTPALVIIAIALVATLRTSKPSLKPNLYWLPFATFGLFYFINALAPEVSADGTFYHLTYPARYLHHGGFFRVTTNFYANLSQGLEMLFLMAFAIGKHSAAALTHFAFLIALTAAMIAYGTFIGHSKAGWLAALIVFTSPVIAIDATVAYNDVALSAVLFTLLFALTRWTRDRSAHWLPIAGLLAGFAFDIKYTGAFATLYAIGFVILQSRSLKPALPVALCAAALIAPWMLKNWVYTANPVTPFFNRTFPNPNVTIDFEDDYRENLRHFNGAQLNWRLPISLTLTGNKVQGNLGPAFLLAPLALAGLKNQEVRRLLFIGTLAATPFFANLGTRFLIPAAPFFAMAVAITLNKIPGLAILQTLISIPLIVGLYCDPANWRLSEFPLAAALRLTPESEFISQRLDTYAIAQMVDAHTPANALVYTQIQLPEAYSQRNYMLGYTGALNQALAEMLAMPTNTDFQPIVRLTFHPKAPTHSLKLVQTGNCGGPWSLAEVRWTPGQSATSITAHPEPWRAQWARDANPATRWKVWQNPQPGMYWQATFATPTSLETVEIDASPDQSNTCIALTTDAETLKNPVIQAIPLPADIRRQVLKEFHKQGITHLLLAKEDPTWGLPIKAKTGPATLYTLETFQESNVSIDLYAKTRNNHK